MTNATVIPIDDPRGTTLPEDMHAEVARLRRLLGSFWSARDAGKAELANVLLEAHEAVENIDTLATELSLRTDGAR